MLDFQITPQSSVVAISLCFLALGLQFTDPCLNRLILDSHGPQRDEELTKLFVCGPVESTSTIYTIFHSGEQTLRPESAPATVRG